MGVRQASKHEVATAIRDRYWAASRAGKGRLLDEFCAVAGAKHVKNPFEYHNAPCRSEAGRHHTGEYRVARGEPRASVVFRK
jgi:hypothetical protein